MKFYTHVSRQFNTLYVRGYENGQRYKEEIEYQPYVFVQSHLESEFKSLSGASALKAYPGNMRNTSEYIAQNGKVSGRALYGIEAYEYQYLNDQFAGEIDYDPSLVSVVTLDIECR